MSDLERETTCHQLGIAFGPLSLPRQRANLALHLGDKIVNAAEIGRGLLETSFGASLAVAVQPHSRRFLEQLSPIVGPVAQQGVHHPRFDHYARVGTEPGAADHIVDIAKAARRPVEEIVALSRPAQSSGDDDFAERDVERAIVVLEVQGDLREIDGPARGRSLENHFFHLGAAKRARALLAEHPPHRIGDVGLSAAVRADDRRHARLEDHLRVIGERLESVNLELR